MQKQTNKNGSSKTSIITTTHANKNIQLNHQLVSLHRSSFTSGSDEDNGFSGYQTAAQRGAYGEDCASYYKECALPIAPVKATLKKLLTLLLKA